MAELPSGTVTFLFTDLEGSTRLWEDHPEAMHGALARHDEILRAAIAVHDGHVVKTTGDGVHAAFAEAPAAVLAARDAQLALAAEPWAATGPLKVRMGVHTGHAEARDGDYYGSSVNRAARLMSAANGGQVVVSLTTEELVRDELSDGVALRDLGEQRLRDLSRPEHTYQLVAPGLEEAFASLRSLDAYPSNLPQQVTSFVGRQREQAEIAQALESSRVVTVTGVGGVGKTRLATQVAADVLPRFTDGAWLCELAAAADRESMLQLVAMTVGVSARAGTTLEQGIADFVQSKQLLLVLDNCEHLLDAASELVELLVQQSADARVLVTSREGLGVVGEQIWPLRSLPVAADAAAASDAAQLFEDRARAARPDFVLDGNNAATVVELCRRLDGIPLAIELAAARVAAMSPAEIADLLDERFRLLTGGRRTAVERHQTLRATVDWSYSLLTDTERVVFDRLGVFAGSFDVHAAAAVAVGDGVERWDVLDSLVSLVAKSMVVAEDDEPGTTRYQLLETLRQYARERLDGAGLADDVRRRHATHYAERAEALVPRLQGAEEIAARRQIGADLDDLRAAVFWAADSQADGELAVRVVAALASESIQNQQAGIGSWAVRIVPLARLSTAGRRFAALGAAASQYVTVGDYESARRHGNDAIVQPTPPDCSFPYLPYFALQQIEAYEGRPEAAYDLAVSSREQLEADGADAFSIAVLYGCAAVWAISANNLDLACAEADEALRRGRVLQNPTVLGTALFDLGWALADTDPERALASFEEHIDLVRRGGGDGAFAPSLAMVSALWARRGDLSTAVARFDESVEFALRGGLPVTFVGCLNYGIEMLATSGRHDACALLYGVVRVGPIESAIAGYYTSPSWTGAIDDAKRVLGAERFDALVAEGAAMSYDEVAGWIRALLDDLRAVVTNS